MSKITRQFGKMFGGLGDSGFFGKFGSKRAGSPIYTKDIPTIQQLPAFDDGLQEAVNDSNKAPFMEDFNSLFYVMSYMQKYLFQEGIPEWNTDEIYFIGSIVKNAGTSQLFMSKTDNNSGNALPSTTSSSAWKILRDLGDDSMSEVFGYLASDVTIHNATPITIPFTLEYCRRGAIDFSSTDFDPTTYEFIAPTSGMYHISAAAAWNYYPGFQRILYCYINGVVEVESIIGSDNFSYNNRVNNTVSYSRFLNAGDRVQFGAYCSDVNPAGLRGNNVPCYYTYFTIAQLTKRLV